MSIEKKKDIISNAINTIVELRGELYVANRKNDRHIAEYDKLHKEYMVILREKHELESRVRRLEN